MRKSQYNVTICPGNVTKRSSSMCRCDANGVMLVQTVYMRKQQEVRQYVLYMFISVNN